MVWPALIAAAGAGMQMYGADQKTQAAQNAQSAYQQWLNRFNGVQDVQDTQMNDLMGAIGDQYQGDQQQLTNSFNPTDRVSAYTGGETASRNGIEQALALMAAGRPHPMLPTNGEQGIFSQTAAREQATNAAAAGRLTDVTAQGAGLSAMANRDAENVFQFSNSAHDLQNRINRAQQLYQLGQALRNRSLARASGQHDADLAKAQLAGNGWMMAGGLAGAVSQGLGANQANKGAPATKTSGADPSVGGGGWSDPNTSNASSLMPPPIK